MSEETRIILVNNLTPNDYIKVSNNFYRLEKEIIRLNNIINDLHNGLEKIIEQGYDYNEKDKIAIELISKIWK